jgi:hypothetical protein
MRHRTKLVATAAAALSLVAASATAAGAHSWEPSEPTVSEPLASGLAGPLQFAVRHDGTVYVAQNFAGLLTKIGKHSQADIAANPGGEIAGVAVSWHGSVVYTQGGQRPDGSVFATLDRVKRHGGGSSFIADLAGFEEANNPDQGNRYGFQAISDECAAQLPAEVGPPSYTGIVESHPYAVALRHGRQYVADAAGNDILEVYRGEVRTVAVLPPQPAVITEEMAASVGLPDCVVGLTYDFEPVPTDVEVGSNGMLYVTTLPGGPEDPSFGARGSVYVVNPWTGASYRLATGLAGATNLAIGGHGAIYVAELFAGRVSRISHGKVEPYIELPDVAAVEYARGRLYVSYDVFADGKVATIER